MNRYVQQALEMHDDPRSAWQWALSERNRNPDPELANAEHFLWNRYYAGQGPLQAAGAFVTPFGYYLGKNLGLLSGRSPSTLDQLRAGLLGAYEGL